MTKIEKNEKSNYMLFMKKYSKNIAIIFLYIMLVATLCVVFIIPNRDSESIGLWVDEDIMSSGGIALLVIDFIAIIIMVAVMYYFGKDKSVLNYNKRFNIGLAISMLTFALVLIVAILSNPAWFSEITLSEIRVNILIKFASEMRFHLVYTTAGVVLTTACSLGLVLSCILYASSFFNKKQTSIPTNKKTKK